MNGVADTSAGADVGICAQSDGQNIRTVSGLEQKNTLEHLGGTDLDDTRTDAGFNNTEAQDDVGSPRSAYRLQMGRINESIKRM